MIDEDSRAARPTLDVRSLPNGWLDRLQSPALIVSLDAARRNIAVVLAQVGLERWRPHLKTTKIPAVWRELLRIGVRRFKCATTREASLLLALIDDEGVRDADLLVAYPLVGPGLSRLGQLARRFPSTRVSVLTEDPELRDLPEPVGLFVDLNSGMDRTGLPPERWSEVTKIARRAGERFRGLHYYDGHHHQPAAQERRDAIERGYGDLRRLCDELIDAGVAIDEVVTAGTPAFLSALDAMPLRSLPSATVHRVSPGTVVFHDVRSAEENPTLNLTPAAMVLSRVVSQPRADIVTCDAGSKSLAAEAGDPCASVLGHPELRALTPSEEHLPLRVTSGSPPARGTPLLLIPRHVCPTVNLADEVLLVDGETAQLVRVAGRGHELLLDES